MHEAAHTYLAAWENFYIIVGSSAGALTGLQFVVITLIAELRPQSSGLEISAFGTPTVVHFCAVLLVGAILSAPWGALSNVALSLGLCGLAGVIYASIVAGRARRQSGYEPEVEDWIWFAILPLLSYAALFIASIVLPRSPEQALFVIAAASLALLFTGIHNAWDTVTYITVMRPGQPKPDPPSTAEEHPT